MKEDDCTDIKQLRYFLAIAEEGQILGAAKRLHMAQPPLSQQLKLLENELQIQLVERGSRRIQLTDAGLKLRDRAARIIELVETTEAEIREMKEGFEGMLSIGTVASLGTSILPEYIQSFNLKYPRVRFQLWEGDSYKVTELLDKGIAEIGIVRFPYDTETYSSINLPNEPMVAAWSDFWNLEEDTEQFKIKMLEGKPIMVHRRHEKLVEECCKKAGFEPDILCKSDDVRSILTWALADIGIAIVPKSAIDYIPSNVLKCREIPEKSLETTAAIIWVRNRHLSTPAKHFTEMFSAIYKT
ncbi:MAG TPA: LysR family transcriptional regulator [Ruminiclostridium sp.]|nr:LysR family transcriptional regulator [Ruminiclostridium sp.]